MPITPSTSVILSILLLNRVNTIKRLSLLLLLPHNYDKMS